MKHCVCSGPIGGLPGWHCGVMLFEEVVKDKNAGRAWGQVTKWPDTQDQSAGLWGAQQGRLPPHLRPAAASPRGTADARVARALVAGRLAAPRGPRDPPSPAAPLGPPRC